MKKLMMTLLAMLMLMNQGAAVFAEEATETTAEVSDEEVETTETEAVTDAQEVTEESEEAVKSEEATETESVKEVSAEDKAEEVTEVSAGTDRTAVAAEEEPLMLTATSSEPATTEETKIHTYFGKIVFYDEDNKYNSRTGGLVPFDIYPVVENLNLSSEEVAKRLPVKRVFASEENGWSYFFVRKIISDTDSPAYDVSPFQFYEDVE